MEKRCVMMCVTGLDFDKLTPFETTQAEVLAYALDEAGLLKENVEIETLVELFDELKTNEKIPFINYNDFYKVFYSDDDAIKKALEVIENQKSYEKLLVINPSDSK